MNKRSSNPQPLLVFPEQVGGEPSLFSFSLFINKCKNRRTGSEDNEQITSMFKCKEGSSQAEKNGWMEQ